MTISNITAVYNNRATVAPMSDASFRQDHDVAEQVVMNCASATGVKAALSYAVRIGESMVFNTSFNKETAVVCWSEEALDCYLRTTMDVLLMDNWIVERRG